jgi:selT/selW/selH-like putative selenoprotein
VEVEIRHCPTCKGYDRKAAKLATALTDAGHPTVAVAGETSQFDVFADGELVYSKSEAGRLPQPYDILRALAVR